MIRSQSDYVLEGRSAAAITPLVLAATRVLAAWLAEESTALRNEVAAILPAILAVAMESPYGQRVLPDCNGDTNTAAHQCTQQITRALPMVAGPLTLTGRACWRRRCST